MMKFCKILFVFFLSGFIALHSIAQKCYKKDSASEELMADFDYRGQSYYNHHKSGDTVKVNAVIYARQEYRIFVLTDHSLGNCKYNVIGQTKAIKSEVKEIVRKNTPKGVVIDTIWARTAYTTNAIIFDSSENPDEKFWETRSDKTGLVTIQVILPSDAKSSGCVQVMIGRKFMSSRVQQQKKR